jgi:hypothetical protein
MEENKLISMNVYVFYCSKITDRIESSPCFRRSLEGTKWTLYSDKYKDVRCSELGVVVQGNEMERRVLKSHSLCLQLANTIFSEVFNIQNQFGRIKLNY